VFEWTFVRGNYLYPAAQARVLTKKVGAVHSDNLAVVRIEIFAVDVTAGLVVANPDGCS